MGFLIGNDMNELWAWENERLEWLVNSAVGYLDDYIEDSEVTTILKTGAFRARDESTI